MPIMKNFFAGAILSMLLAACAGSGERPEAGKSVDELLAEKNLRIDEKLSQVYNFNIRGFQYVNRENVILEEGVRKKYLVELNSPCYNLEYAVAIGFTSYGRMVTTSDHILVRDAPGRAQRCKIRALYSLEETDGGNGSS